MKQRRPDSDGQLRPQTARHVVAVDKMSTNRTLGYVDHRAGGALDRIRGGASIQPPREDDQRIAQLIVHLLQRCPKVGIVHLADEILAPHRSQQPRVCRLFDCEVVNGQSGGDGCLNRIAIASQRLQKAVLRPAHTA